jgi:hypothetical protein
MRPELRTQHDASEFNVQLWALGFLPMLTGLMLAVKKAAGLKYKGLGTWADHQQS